METYVLPKGSTLFHYSASRFCSVLFANEPRQARTNRGRAAQGVFFILPEWVQQSIMSLRGALPYRFEVRTKSNVEDRMCFVAYLGS